MPGWNFGIKPLNTPGTAVPTQAAVWPLPVHAAIADANGTEVFLLQFYFPVVDASLEALEPQHLGTIGETLRVVVIIQGGVWDRHLGVSLRQMHFVMSCVEIQGDVSSICKDMNQLKVVKSNAVLFTQSCVGNTCSYTSLSPCSALLCSVGSSWGCSNSCWVQLQLHVAEQENREGQVSFLPSCIPTNFSSHPNVYWQHREITDLAVKEPTFHFNEKSSGFHCISRFP